MPAFFLVHRIFAGVHTLAAVCGREADIIFALRLVSGAYGIGFLIHEGYSAPQVAQRVSRPAH
jgi:hypothetical protein